MKILFLALMMTVSFAGAAITEDGKGFFPVMVQVVDADTGTPIKGVMVRLEDAGDYKELELDPKRQTKVLPESLGKVVVTNAEGVAVVFYYGGWSSAIIDGKSVYSMPLAGTLIVEYGGKEIYRSTLKTWAQENGFKADSASAPLIIVSPPAAK